jgi:integrase
MAFYANKHVLLDGAVVLHQRQSPNGNVCPTWQARLKLPGRSGYIKISCKTKNYEEAYAVAKEQYLSLQQKVRDGVPLKDWAFKQHWNDWYERQLSKGVWSEDRKKWHKNYFNRYFDAYFGDKPLSQITASFADSYWEWRISYWQGPQGQKLRSYNPKRRAAKSQTTQNAKSVPSDKTLHMEQSALNQIFADACLQRRMPYLKLKAPKPSKGYGRGATFDEREFRVLTENLINWALRRERYKDARLNAYQRRRRLQFVCYAGLIAESGLRPGEPRQMRWEDISTLDDPGGSNAETGNLDLKHLVIRVRDDTKTGFRNVIAMPRAWLWVNLWQSKSPHTEPQDYVWQGQGSHETGTNTISGDFGKTFQSFLRTVPYKGRADGLLCDADGRHRTLYSLRHYYATQRLIHGDLDSLSLAENMGTSVAQIQRHYSHVTTMQNAPKLTADKRRNKASDAAHRARERSVEEALERLATDVVDTDATESQFGKLKSR